MSVGVVSGRVGLSLKLGNYEAYSVYLARISDLEGLLERAKSRLYYFLIEYLDTLYRVYNEAVDRNDVEAMKYLEEEINSVKYYLVNM